MRKRRPRMGVKFALGTKTANVTAPIAMTERMYHRARVGSSRSKTT
jgi:hypothetical protein